jgi:SAM-dependent methyltransferase
MSDQAQLWSRAAASYEREYVDPYRADVRSPLLKTLQGLSDTKKDAADFGCGVGPLLPVLAKQFRHVYAVDFAPGMLERARGQVVGVDNVEFLQRGLTDLTSLAGRVDVAAAVNSLVMPSLDDLETALGQIRRALRPGGHFVGIVPSVDGVHYYTMVLLDRARKMGLPPEKARQNAAHHAEHDTLDFGFGEFHHGGLRQHFWHPFEIRYRLRRAGFPRVRVAKVHLSWEQFGCNAELRREPPPWDWFFHATV